MSTCLTQRPSVCMHYWLALYWLLLPQPCSIDWRLWPVNRAANFACLWLFYFLFFFGGSFWCQRLAQSSLCPWQPGRFTGSSSLCSESLRSGRGDEVEARLREGCQGFVVQHSRSSPRLPVLGLCIHGERHVFGLVCPSVVQFVHLSGQTTTTPCSCVEPGPAWLSCNVTGLRDRTDSLKVNTLCKVSQNVGSELSNSVSNFFRSFFFPITFSYFVARCDDVIYFLLSCLTCHEVPLSPLNYSSPYLFFFHRSIVAIGLALPTEHLELAGLFWSFIVLWLSSEEWMSLEAVTASRPPWPPGYLSVTKVKTKRIPFLNFNTEVPPEQSL